MSRIRCLLVIRQVTADAGGAQGCILAAGMAGRALLARMRSCEGELRFAVVECCSLPAGRRVTERAILREARRGMIRVRRFLIVRQVAGGAGSA